MRKADICEIASWWFDCWIVWPMHCWIFAGPSHLSRPWISSDMHKVFKWIDCEHLGLFHNLIYCSLPFLTSNCFLRTSEIEFEQKKILHIRNTLTSKTHPNSVDPFVHWTCSVRIERLILWHGPDLHTDKEFHLIVDRVEFYLKSPPAELLTSDIVSMMCQRYATYTDECITDKKKKQQQEMNERIERLKKFSNRWQKCAKHFVGRMDFVELERWNLQFFKDFLHFGALGKILI